MYLDSKKKQAIFEKYGKSDSDTGNSEGQIALFTERINHLTDYLKENKKILMSGGQKGGGGGSKAF